MSEKPKNPPLGHVAFDREADIWTVDTDITLRDLFAVAAVAGMTANPRLDDSLEVFSRVAYSLADEMLREREK